MLFSLVFRFDLYPFGIQVMEAELMAQHWRLKNIKRILILLFYVLSIIVRMFKLFRSLFSLFFNLRTLLKWFILFSKLLAYNHLGKALHCDKYTITISDME